MPSDAAYQAFWGSSVCSCVPFEHHSVLFILLVNLLVAWCGCGCYEVKHVYTCTMKYLVIITINFKSVGLASRPTCSSQHNTVFVADGGFNISYTGTLLYPRFNNRIIRHFQTHIDMKLRRN